LGISFDKRSPASSTLTYDQVDQLRLWLRGQVTPTLEGAEKFLSELEGAPLRELLGPVDEMVGHLAQKLGKKLVFDVRGADLRVDPARLAPIMQTLPQLLRNAVDHGLEAPEARGTKPDVGRLSLEVLETEASYVVAVQDDGRGIDRAAVLRAAVARGVVSEGNARMMAENDVLKLVLRERVSTAPVVTDISGRGYGLSYVQTEAKRLGGDIVVHSRAGRGTRIEVTVPKAARLDRRQSQAPLRSDTVQFRTPGR
ncbi:MAG TPA: ATP-binding protein, partial [Polyangiaceae bacterium]|nr:ATP-binding protein [Polyangiaceae bacterium]